MEKRPLLPNYNFFFKQRDLLLNNITFEGSLDPANRRLSGESNFNCTDLYLSGKDEHRKALAEKGHRYHLTGTAKGVSKHETDTKTWTNSPERKKLLSNTMLRWVLGCRGRPVVSATADAGSTSVFSYNWRMKKKCAVRRGVRFLPVWGGDELACWNEMKRRMVKP